MADRRLIAALASALPVVFFVALAVIGKDSQFSELFAHPVLERRAAQAAAAAAVTVGQLAGRYDNLVPAVTDAIPLYPSPRVSLLQNRKSTEPAEAFTGQVFIAGLFAFTAAGCHPSVF